MMSDDLFKPGEPSRDDLARILEDALAEFYLFDAETLKFYCVSRGARENLGYTSDELRDVSILNIAADLHSDDFTQWRACEGGEGPERPVRVDTALQRKDGSCYSVHLYLHQADSRFGPVFIAVVLETTDDGREIHAAKEREGRLQAILDSAVEAIITIDEHGICESINRAAERMFGYHADELIGENISILMPSPNREMHDTYIADYLRTGKKKIIGIGRDTTARRKDGSEFPIHLSVSEVCLGGRRLFTGLVHDVTERQESQRKLVQSERLSAVGEAMTGLAHESRNLLQKIQMAVESSRLELTEETSIGRQLDNIEKAADELHSLLNEVRSFAAPIQLAKTKCSLPSLWREAWQLLSGERQGRRAELIEKLDVSDLHGYVDRFRIVQVFRNLLDNSLAACPDPVEIVLCVSESGTIANPLLHIVFSDNGPGLTSEMKDRIFEPFFTTKAKGTGLGMAIAQRIIEAHGGRITVGADRRVGAEFQIFLPW